MFNEFYLNAVLLLYWQLVIKPKYRDKHSSTVILQIL